MITKREESASVNEIRHLSKLKQLEFCQNPTRTEQRRRSSCVTSLSRLLRQWMMEPNSIDKQRGRRLGVLKTLTRTSPTPEEGPSYTCSCADVSGGRWEKQKQVACPTNEIHLALPLSFSSSASLSPLIVGRIHKCHASI
jgi:hypothetical protein